jgi:hypothetical protein
VEPSQPVDPIADESPVIPQARRGGGGRPEPEHEFGPLIPANPDPPGDAAGAQAPPVAPPVAPPQAPDPPQGSSAAVPPPAPLPSVWNARSITLIVAGVLMALCVGGMGTAYFAYQRAVEPDRANPGVVVTRYVEAAFNTRSTTEAKRYTCSDPASIAESRSLLAEIEGREREHNVRIDVAIGDLDTRTTGSTSTVATQLRLKTVVNGRFQEQIQYWEYSLRNRSGWRVCGAHRVG